MAFREQQESEHREEARLVSSRLRTWLLLGLLVAGYLGLGRTLGIYDWRLGIASVLALILIISQAISNVARWYKLRVARACPVCGGLFKVEEKVLQGNIMDGIDSLPPIIDRISTCESCGRQHHHVYAATGESGPAVAMSLSEAAGSLIHNRKSIMQRRYPGKSDAEIDQMLAELDAMPKPAGTTRAEWEQIFQQLQQEAATKNREQGMEFTKERRQ